MILTPFLIPLLPPDGTVYLTHHYPLYKNIDIDGFSVNGCWWLTINVADLVFFQNGMLEPWLQSKGLSDANQVLAYFAVSKLGESPVDGKTDTNPEGLTAAFGNWASDVASRLHAASLSCKVKELWSLKSNYNILT
jgi:hypothetical protein